MVYLVAWHGGLRVPGVGGSDGGLLELEGGEKPCWRSREERNGKEAPQPWDCEDQTTQEVEREEDEGWATLDDQGPRGRRLRS